MTAWSEGDIQANGITIHYYRTDGNNKPPILLLHGFTDSGLCWPRVSHDLEGSYDVTMTDARGHGHSGDSAADFSLALLADDAAAVIGALNLEKPYVLGHSMGAMTAATVAATYPDLVRAIVPEDPLWSLVDGSARLGDSTTGSGRHGRPQPISCRAARCTSRGARPPVPGPRTSRPSQATR